MALRARNGISVAITGSAGLIGTILARGLNRSYEVFGIDRRKTRKLPGIVADTTSFAALQPAFRDKEIVIDLAAHASVATSWQDVLTNNVRSTVNVLEAARQAGVMRVIVASSNHVTGMYELEHPYAAIAEGNYEGLDPQTIPQITSAHPIRPDSAYGTGKAFAEAAGRYYSDEFGLSVICLRIGTVTKQNRPTKPRDFATLLTHRDLVHLVECCIQAPEHVRFATLYGVSSNTWRFWDIESARDIVGYRPRDDAEQWR
jgi:nucleoside-diphosphate-sugar epimerase